MKYLIIAPHVDDEIYSCMSVIENVINDKNSTLNILYLSSSRKQKERLSIVASKLSSHYNLNFIINTETEGICLDNRISLIPINAFPDTGSKFDQLGSIIKTLDIFMEKSDYAFIPGISQHQDHIITYICSKASTRYRDKLKNLKGIFTYEYPYNHDSIKSGYFRELSEEGLNLKLEILKELNTIDNILSTTSVNSERYVISLNTINGCRANVPYAESFDVEYLVVTN